jgi:cyclic dehypoxanthinyl futalosine synthase
MTNLIDDTADIIDRGGRVTAETALALLQSASLLDLADLAGRRRTTLHPERTVTFVVDRNINYTNVCLSGCKFCAFFREPGQTEGYVLTETELKQKIEETLALGGTQILLQGGLNPGLMFSDYLDMLHFIKQNFEIHIHGFSPPEIIFMAEKSGQSIHACLEALVAAGLGSIPGGGAEILVDDIREQVSPRKYRSDQWLEVMDIAHKMGLKSTATMMFGHIETPKHVIDHLEKIRTQQDLTGGFTAFIPWSFQPGNTKIDVRKAGASEYLRVLAVSRIFLDNIPNLQVSWVTQGDKIAQVALEFGANDFGSTMIEENVVAAAGVRFRLPREEIIRLIQDAGYTAKQRDCFYNVVKTV